MNGDLLANRKDTAFSRVDFSDADDRQALDHLCREYFLWMNDEVLRSCGFSIPDVIRMSIEDYVRFTMDIGSRIKSEDGGIFLLRDAEGKALAMGGLRRLPDGAAEIVRIFTRPECRGGGYGTFVFEGLLKLARDLAYREVYLDTGIFMTSAHKIYNACGFTPCEPYPGAEPPDELQPYWLYMKKVL